MHPGRVHPFELQRWSPAEETSKRKKGGVGPPLKRKFAGQAPPAGPRSTADSDDRDKGRRPIVSCGQA